MGTTASSQSSDSDSGLIEFIVYGKNPENARSRSQYHKDDGPQTKYSAVSVLLANVMFSEGLKVHKVKVVLPGGITYNKHLVTYAVKCFCAANSRCKDDQKIMSSGLVVEFEPKTDMTNSQELCDVIRYYIPDAVINVSIRTQQSV